MEKTLILLCPFSNSQNFLVSRFPKKDVRFLTALGGIFPFEDRIFVEMMGNFLISENIKEVYFVQDLHSKFLSEGMQEALMNPNDTVKRISEVFARHQVEILSESSLSQQRSKLSLFVIEEQVQQMLCQLTLQRIIQENKIQIKGMLTDQSRAKSIEFHVQPELQLS
jgi:hypothetical protein